MGNFLPPQDDRFRMPQSLGGGVRLLARRRGLPAVRTPTRAAARHRLQGGPHPQPQGHHEDGARGRRVGLGLLQRQEQHTTSMQDCPKTLISD